MVLERFADGARMHGFSWVSYAHAERDAREQLQRLAPIGEG